MKQFTQADFDNLARDLDQIKANTQKKVGQTDARYIRKVILVHRIAAIAGRILIFAGCFVPWILVPGILLLALAKILDNMEIGHNVMHGQYDWMNDANINSNKFEWDIASDAGSWKRVHNYEHHTYTNIVGKDRDFGYGLLRLSNDFRWRVKNLWQLLTYATLSLLFQWGVSYHELAGERVFFGKKKQGRKSSVSHSELKKAFFAKGARQIFKDYLLFPALAGPFFVTVLLANLAANVLRNLWTSTIIFCGHFPGQTRTFTKEECENESKGQWYYRQALGSANINGKPWFHILSGHLSLQIEHHLFPDMPSSRYQEVAPQVREVFARYGIPYNTGHFARQYGSVVKRIARYSFP